MAATFIFNCSMPKTLIFHWHTHTHADTHSQKKKKQISVWRPLNHIEHRACKGSLEEEESNNTFHVNHTRTQTHTEASFTHLSTHKHTHKQIHTPHEHTQITSTHFNGMLFLIIGQNHLLLYSMSIYNYQILFLFRTMKKTNSNNSKQYTRRKADKEMPRNA